MSRRRAVLVTGANGYLGNAVAKAFCAAGWDTYGLTRRREAMAELTRGEIRPVLGTPEDLSFLDDLDGVTFDTIVSNTEDRADPERHFGQVRTMVERAADRREQAGTRPLLLFTSGCKDYGAVAEKHGDASLAPQDETSPLRPPEPLRPRCAFGASLLDGPRTSYDAAVLRPTIVYGLSSSHYGPLFDLAAGSSRVLRIAGHPDAIMHSCHVADCARAYVLLSEHSERTEVAGHAYNVANAHYETAREVGEALAKSYGLALEFVEPDMAASLGSVGQLANFWQWVGSDKVRDLTGWADKRAGFAEGIDTYRAAYEALGKA